MAEAEAGSDRTGQHGSTELLARLVERSNDPYLVLDADTTVRWANDAVSVLGWRRSDIIGRSALELIDRASLDRALAALDAIAQGHHLDSSAPYDILTPEGSTVECDVTGVILSSEGEQPEAIGVHARPTQDSRILRTLLEKLLGGDPADDVLTSMLDLLYHRNIAARVIVLFEDEDGATRMIGDPLDDALGGVGAGSGTPWGRARSTGEEVVVESVDELDADVAATARTAGLRDCWIVPVRSGDRHVATITKWTVDGGPPAQVDSYSIDLLRRLIELVLRWRRQTRELERAATRDPLTGLPNRRAVGEFDATGPRRDLGVLYVDLDRFKQVNDGLGHAAGDQVLRTVATRLQSAIRPTDMVARLGGDEFGVICPGCTRDELSELADRVHELLGDPIGVHGEVVTIGSSIGATIGHDRAGPLLEAADHALYEAKADGRGTIRWTDRRAVPRSVAETPVDGRELRGTDN